MSSDLDIIRASSRLADDGIPFVLITVIKAQGSTPRNAGAKMLWHPSNKSDGELIGTVGGGQFELLVLDAAKRCLATRTPAVERYVLGSDADQCCGGVMEVFFECHGFSQRIVIFGAGHVARELAPLLAPAGHELIIADTRADWNSLDRFPDATRRIHHWDSAVSLCHEAPASTLACVMTCSHDTDFELLHLLLKSPPAYTGLIGSRSKRVCLFGRLVAAGIDDALVQAVQCPMGVGDCGKEPRLVAVSIAAGLLMLAKTLPRLSYAR